MVRPNQIVRFEDNEMTFIMFAQNEKQVKRRVLFINFPRTIKDVVFGDENVDDFITDTELVKEGRVNRYTVTLDISKV